ncbi:MBL fold metallo-hydrolase [Vibrio mangrovi]|uniref:Hydroxyacylglutathione hydrolase n=1 Tax=Vibrio mangrovi TaxID=474394 RepID=A0A1Y6IVY6_9VIBR|nr:MBL fold metallo-hydrolase [Vibrio mangrovi]MDW6005056.1 MBL fold metallo-hydrolase [Vibrio mangrovi]SMS01824.1 Hydroxyacylglutathione hydrolase [Vibrio mangrovi]
MKRPKFLSIFSMIAAAVTFSVQADVPEAPSTVSAVYRAPSVTEALAPGEKIGNLFHLNIETPYVLQRLTDRTYWYQSGFYGTIFYVGHKGVLLFDPLELRSDKILESIRKVTQKPITAIVYSHDHGDHIGGTQALLNAIKNQARPPRIIASQATADKMERLNSQLPRPTETISWPNGSFNFDGLKVELHGFEHAAHTDDHSAWLLVGERVLHAPDLLNSDQPPFWNFAGSERFTYLESNLKEANALDWDYFSGGHGNVGSHDDFTFHLKFIADLKAAVAKAMGEVPFGFGVDTSTINAHTIMLPTWYDEIARRATESLRPAYGQFYGFETATPANAVMIAEYLYSYR